MKLSSKGRKKQCNMSKLIAAGIPLAAMLSAGANAAEVKYQADVRGKMLLTEPDRRKYHTVKPDENLSIIAKKYQTTVKKLCELNKFTPEQANKIFPGQKILIPQESSKSAGNAAKEEKNVLPKGVPPKKDNSTNEKSVLPMPVGLIMLPEGKTGHK